MVEALQIDIHEWPSCKQELNDLEKCWGWGWCCWVEVKEESFQRDKIR